FGIAEDRRAGLQRGSGRLDKALAELEFLYRLDQPAGMDHADGDIGLGLGEAREIGLSANDGEGALIDRVAVVHIVVGRHAHPGWKSAAAGAPPRRARLVAALSCARRSSRRAAAMRPKACASVSLGKCLTGVCRAGAERTRPTRPFS